MAPWASVSASSVTRPTSRTGSGGRGTMPVKLPFWLMGKPCRRSPERHCRAARAGGTLPMVRLQSHVARHRGLVDLAPVLEGHAPDDEGQEDQHEGQVQGREHGGVPDGERREHGRPGHDEPDLVAVPERADAVDGDPALEVGLADDQWRTPTPRSKPSRMKKPVQKKAMTMNQKICKSHRRPPSRSRPGSSFVAGPTPSRRPAPPLAPSLRSRPGSSRP